jgi:hypothetical protein
MAAGAGRVSAVRTILIFALLGPPIGYAVFFVWVVGTHWLRHGRLTPEFVFLVEGFPFSYLFGIVPALVAGGIVAAIKATSTVKLLPVAGTGVAVGLAFAIVMVAYLGSFLLPVSICLIPTLICWRLAR